jgi:hypothetical protein
MIAQNITGLSHTTWFCDCNCAALPVPTVKCRPSDSTVGKAPPNIGLELFVPASPLAFELHLRLI